MIIAPRAFTKKHRGFTLIELLVVIAIIGLLASVILVNMGGARKSARNGVRKADMRQLITAQQIYYGNNSKFYTCSTTGGNCAGKPLNYPSAIADTDNTYIASTPKDPGSNTYTGVDNTAAGNDQKFCYYVALETTPVTYHTSSHGGNFTKAAAPTGATASAILDDCATP